MNPPSDPPPVTATDTIATVAPETPSPGWLLISISTGSANASLRVHVWRKLRGLGGVYLHNSVCLLPDLTDVTRQITRLLDRVQREGGTGRLLHIDIPRSGERDELIAQFNAARDDEYNEVLQRLPEFFAELDRETERGRTTYAEVEENETDLKRYRSWLATITARDYFDAPHGRVARAELDRAEDAFTAFEARSLAAEQPPEG